MASSRYETKWIAAGAALAAVAVVAAAVLVVSVAGNRGGTDEIDPTSTTSAETLVPPTTGRPTPTTQPAEPEDVRIEKVVVPTGLIQREYTVMTPIDPPAGAMPAVVALHGLGVDATAMMNDADWRTAVAQRGFVAVFPQGSSNSWNLGPCCPPANLFGIDDQAFLDLVVDGVVARGDVDAERVYLTGFSNGAVMAYAYACARSERLAAVAPMSGSNLTGCRPGQPLSLLHQHSETDLVVPFYGGLALGVLVSSAPFPNVPDSVAAWAAADGCENTPERSTSDDGIERWAWSGCADGTSVELIRVPSVGHAWPRTSNYEGFDEMLRFFDIS